MRKNEKNYKKFLNNDVVEGLSPSEKERFKLIDKELQYNTINQYNRLFTDVTSSELPLVQYRYVLT